MDARAIIAQVRKGQTPPQADLSQFAHGLASGCHSDYYAGCIHWREVFESFFALCVCVQELVL